MRLLRELPEIESKIESGALRLSVLSQAQVFFNREEIKMPEAKIEVLHALEGKSAREAERELAARSSCPANVIPDRIRAVSASCSVVTFAASEELIDQIRELQGILGHSQPGITLGQALAFAVREAVERRRPKTPSAPPASAVEGREPSEEIRRQVWHRDNGRCTYVSPQSGRRCGSSYALEYDHIVPYSKGGQTSIENLRLRCRPHNQLAAIQEFGLEKMAKFVPGLVTSRSQTPAAACAARTD